MTDDEPTARELIVQIKGLRGDVTSLTEEVKRINGQVRDNRTDIAHLKAREGQIPVRNALLALSIIVSAILGVVAGAGLG
ncbi:hypothetical protein ER308_07195 [Egibacter rhizosphaerae]|uniref:Uncharacterized protein n=1 Tax=Egibacter rhizosphaerae TaxID=1670831 RepID=A0A411YDS6_9ACTN|nr:hypothetical protein [Egibacter rhizosphaerae]QBI19351.1 hypothetical protein ER308_07195 [Egibacter rhizosphaerae]